jgi:hypothetical protein
VRRAKRKARYLLKDPASNIVLHCPDYVEPDSGADERALVERIFRSYGRMREDETRADPRYLPSPVWREQLDRAYAHLTDGYRANDLSTFHFFLSNFGAWKEFHGVEDTTLMWDNVRSFLGRRYLRGEVFASQHRLWRWFYGETRPTRALSYPRHGNQSGAFIDGVFVGVNSFSTEIHASLLTDILTPINRPYVAELGAGYGKLAYFVLRDLPAFSYVDFDLPETLCLAAYFLMKTWPSKSALLYGEAELTPSARDDYDLIFMPAYAMEQLGAPVVFDLWMNTYSLGEMSPETVRLYVGQIAETATYFFHMNHELERVRFGAGNAGLLGRDYPIPAGQFRRLFRYPDVSHLLSSQGYETFRTDIFCYLYERLQRPGGGPLIPGTTDDHREPESSRHGRGA